MKALLYSALGIVVGRHPMLSAVPIDGAEDTAYWARLPVVDLAAALDVRAGIDSIKDMERLLEDEHNKRFVSPDGISGIPYWRVVLILGHEEEAEITTFSLVFVYHHAVGDGLSGLVFHRALQAAISELPSPVPEPVATTVIAPSSPPPPALEDLHKFAVSNWHLLRALYHDWFPPSVPPGLWTGAVITTPLRTRIRILHVPASTVTALGARCRAGKTSVTALMISLAAAAFFDALPDSATEIISSAPVSARRWTPPSLDLENAIGVWVTETPAQHHYRGEDVWSTADRVFTAIQNTVSSRGTDTSVALLPWVSSYKKFFDSKPGLNRAATLEISNLGRAPDQKGLMFSQSASVTGHAVEVSVATAGDGMRVTWCWQEGVVEESIVDGMLRRVDERIAAEAQMADK